MNIEINKGITIINNQKPIALENKRVDDKQFIPKPYKEAAQNMEQQFAEYMLQQMNKSVDRTENEDSTGMEYYNGLRTTEQAKIMAQKDNLGLQNVILDQIYPKRMRNELALKQYEAQAERIHHRAPTIVSQDKSDKIIMGKNDSTSDRTEGGP
jgi:Rod binding domain-containing protein